MPNFNPQTQLTRFEADETLNSFLETGHFILTNKIITTKPLDYMKKKLAQQPKSSMGFDYKFYLENVIFDIEIPITYSQNGLREYTDDKIIFFLDEIFKFSSNWSVIALDNLTILQEEHYYPLSLNFIWRFGDLITVAKYNQVRRETENKLIVTNTLIITNAEFHSWAWMELLKIRSKLDNLTIELLPNEDQEDNLLLLFESLGFSGINILNLANTKLTAKGYRL